jgi:aldehyde:ferredoxin oxidoreductase
MDERRLLNIGERAYTLQRMFNIREGITREHDYLPERIQKIPEFGRYSSTSQCEIKHYEQMLDEYYEIRGWDKKTGIPTKEKLQQLNIAISS